MGRKFGVMCNKYTMKLRIYQKKHDYSRPRVYYKRLVSRTRNYRIVQGSHWAIFFILCVEQLKVRHEESRGLSAAQLASCLLVRVRLTSGTILHHNATLNASRDSTSNDCPSIIISHPMLAADALMRMPTDGFPLSTASSPNPSDGSNTPIKLACDQRPGERGAPLLIYGENVMKIAHHCVKISSSRCIGTLSNSIDRGTTGWIRCVQ